MTKRGEQSRLIGDASDRNRAVADKEIRFTAAYNALSSFVYMVASNGCRPPFSGSPYLPIPTVLCRSVLANRQGAASGGAKLAL